MKKQKSIIGTIASRSFKGNKGRNLVAVLAIILTAMMFTTLFTLAQSMGKNMTEMYLRQTGTKAHATAKEVTDAQIEKIADHPEIHSYGKSIVLGMAENQELAGQQVEIRYADDQYAKDSFAYPTAGKMPQSGQEIALDTLIMERLGIQPEIGAQVTLEWREDVVSGEALPRTYTLCGWWEGNSSVYASMAWVSQEYALEACGGAQGPKEGQICGQRMMGITFADTGDIEEKTAKVLSDCGLSDLKFNTNMAYTPEMQQSIFQENLPMYGGMVLVFVAGYLIIFNVFQISVAGDIQFYGKLKTLGMDKKQLKKIIYGQGNRISLMGIPVGLILGYLLGTVLVPVLIAAPGVKPVISASPLIFVGSALFAYLTVLSSCLLPARLAGKVSPVDALRYTDGYTGTKKKKKSKRGASLGEMAWANLWRNKKRTVMVLCSLTLGLVLMSFFYAKNASFDVEKYLMELTVADFQIDDATNSSADGYNPASQTISDTLLEEINDLGAVEDQGRLFSRTMEFALSQQARENLDTFYTQERLDEFASYDPSFPQWKKVFDEAVEGAPVTISVYGADGLILEAAADKKYVMDGAYDAEEFATGNYILAVGPASENQSGLPTYSVGETVEIEGRELRVMAVVHPIQPMVEGNRPTFDLPLILQADTYLELFPDSNLRKFYFNMGDESMEAAQSLLRDYQQTSAVGMNITSRQTMVEQYESQTRAAAVMGYAVSVVVALVGILNFLNSMVTSIISRKKEFAMIQSVGMTKRQLWKMLTFEGIYYAVLTLAASYILSSVTVGVILRAMVSDGYSTFRFTLLPLGICTPILILLAIGIPYLCFRNLERQSIVERLRAV